MDFLDNSFDMLSLGSLILMMLLKTHQALALPSTNTEEEDDAIDFNFFLFHANQGSADAQLVSQAALHHWTLWNSLTAMDEDLGFWVKPRSTTWFTKFLLEEYDDERWIKFFRMTKRSVLSLASLLTPAIRRRDTNYREAVPVTVRLACSLFKICQGTSLLICSELFAVGRSTVSIMLRDVVHAINVVLRKEITWPIGDQIPNTASQFQNLCGLPGVLGAIDGTHFIIKKPKTSAGDYYYFKTGGFSMQCQAVVDSSKRFLDMHVGMLGSTNDSRVLRRSTLFHRGQRQTLWEGHQNFHGYSPYLLGDAGYPLLPWLMVPHRRQLDLGVAPRLFNRRLSKGRAVVENAFAQLKMTFRELHKKSDLHVTFLPDVVIACGILHNVLLKQSHDEVEALLEVLRAEGLQNHANEVNIGAVEEEAEVDGLPNAEASEEKRSDLGVFLTFQRIVPF